MVRLSPMLVAIVCCSEVYLTPEVEEFFAKHGPQLHAFGHLQGAGVKRDLQSAHEVALWYAVVPGG
jgi:hypothetical protein